MSNSTFSILNPGFLKRFDNYLLTHFPLVWSSRIHYTAYYSLWIIAIIAVIAMISPLDIYGDVDAEGWYLLMSLVSVTGIVIWIAHLLRFNLVKQFGKRPAGDEYINFALYSACFLMLVSFVFVYPVTQSVKISLSYSDKDLKNDLNALNLGNYFFTGDSAHLDLRTDLKLFNRDGNDNIYIDKDSNQYQINNYYISNFFSYYRYRGEDLRTPYDNYVLYRSLSTREARLKAIRAFMDAAAKYGQRNTGYAEDILHNWENNKDSLFATQDEYMYEYRNGLENTIGNIVKLKYRFYIFYDDEFLLAMWYLLFYLTIFMLIYKNVRGKAYIMSWVSGILVPVLLLLFINMLNGNEERQFMFMVLLIYLFCIIQSVSVLFQNRYSTFKTVCVTLCMVLTPIIPLVFLEYHWTDYQLQLIYHEDSYHLRKYWKWRVQLIGFAAYFVLLQVFFKRLLVKLYSLPQAN